MKRAPRFSFITEVYAVETFTQQADPLFDNKQAAEYIGVAPQTLDVWRSTKRYLIAYVKVGTKVKYRKSALDAFLASRTVAA